MHDCKGASRRNPRFNDGNMPEVYIWRTRGDGRVDPDHAANNGKLFVRSRPHPITGHPGEGYNCRCIAEPVQLQVLELPEEAIAELEVFEAPKRFERGVARSVAQELYLVGSDGVATKMLPFGMLLVRLTSSQLARFLARQVGRARTVQNRLAVSREFIARNWRLGHKKSRITWANQFRKRGWTNADVRRFILRGRRVSVENRINRSNGASRYEMGNTHLVLDDTTHELIQISDRTREFIPH